MPIDDGDLIKAGAQGIVEGAMKPFSDLIKILFGPAAGEAGAMLKESVQRYRYARQLRLFQRTKEVLTSAKIEAAHVPLKLLIPIIEGASNEEEDSLQDTWANLLANAANSDDERRVYPSFPTILKDLTSRDVRFLDGLFKAALARCGGVAKTEKVEYVTFPPKTVSMIYSQAGLAQPDTGDNMALRLKTVQANARNIRLSLDTFERHGVIVRVYGLTQDKSDVGSLHSFTALGACFVQACCAPKDSR